MDWQKLLESSYDWMITTGLSVFIIIVILLIALRIAKYTSKKIFSAVQSRTDDLEFKKRTDTLASVIRYVLSIVLFVIALVMILGEFGIEIGPILAAAGVVGVAVGFGAQHIIKDIIAGFFILMDDEIRVGDVVNVAGKGGIVEKINLRLTVLRDIAGNVHYIPNGTIDVVTNMTKEYSRYVFDIGVAYRENVDEVIEVLKKVDNDLRADKEFKDDIIEPLEILGLDQFGDSAIIIKARYTTQPIRQWRIGREFNRRMKIAFDKENIEIPFPHMTVYMGEDKQGMSPPMRVVLNKNESSEAN